MNLDSFTRRRVPLAEIRADLPEIDPDRIARYLALPDDSAPPPVILAPGIHGFDVYEGTRRVIVARRKGQLDIDAAVCGTSLEAARLRARQAESGDIVAFWLSVDQAKGGNRG